MSVALNHFVNRIFCNGPIQAYFCFVLFSSFSHKIQILFEKSIVGCARDPNQGQAGL